MAAGHESIDVSDEDTAQINQLSEELVSLVGEEDWSRAAAIADRVKDLLPIIPETFLEDARVGRLAPFHIVWLLLQWSYVYEALRDYDKCHQAEQQAIEIKLKYIEREFDSSHALSAYLEDELRDLLDLLEVQALRQDMLHNRPEARLLMERAEAISRRYGIDLDEDQKELYAELTLN